MLNKSKVLLSYSYPFSYELFFFIFFCLQKLTHAQPTLVQTVEPVETFKEEAFHATALLDGPGNSAISVINTLMSKCSKAPGISSNQ